jgi:hypothetical protein
MTTTLTIRFIKCYFAVTAIVAGLPMLAQAAAPETLTLTCNGTATIRADSPRPYPLLICLIVNFATRTVVGTARQRPYVFDQLQITEWNEATVIFRGFSQFLDKNISGSMDRITGDVGMLATSTTQTIDYSLKCTPAQRMF